ncbi:MAG: site-specific DNA-methyltransferase, partial [Candidatus Helarchaeota archaeon]
SGTTPVVAKQLNRNCIAVEIDPKYVELINKRLSKLRPHDDVSKYTLYYKYTQNLNAIWGINTPSTTTPKQKDLFTFLK